MIIYTSVVRLVWFGFIFTLRQELPMQIYYLVTGKGKPPENNNLSHCLFRVHLLLLWIAVSCYTQMIMQLQYLAGEEGRGE